MGKVVAAVFALFSVVVVGLFIASIWTSSGSLSDHLGITATVLLMVGIVAGFAYWCLKDLHVS
jgi:hypothetical protein